MDIVGVVLAAGKGERMVSKIPKVLHPVAGRAMLFYPLEALDRIGAVRRIVVVGHRREEIEASFEGVEFVVQREQLGTAHALLMTEERLREWQGGILILSGDVPLITERCLRGLIEVHRREAAHITMVTVEREDPRGYGRVVRDGEGRVMRVVEEVEAGPEEREIREVNGGIYLISSMPLYDVLKRIAPSERKGEFYLTDIIAMAKDMGYRVSAYLHDDPEEVMGVNTRKELAIANRVMRDRILGDLMASGVTVIDPSSTYVDYGVRVGMDSVLYPNVSIEGSSVVGEGCILENGCKIVDSTIGDGCRIKAFTVIEDSHVDRGVTIGPFARLRPGNRVEEGARIGNFVEVKNSTIGKGTKANHLSYIGDATVGGGVNIGAGTITCNYDGFKKHRTIIEEGAFVGSDTQLVAPVRVGKGAYIGSGSTITKDVPPGALALSRVEQRNIEGWVERRRKREGQKG